MLDLSALPENALQAITGEELHRSTELFNVVKQLRLRLTNVTEEILDRSYEQHVQNVCEQLERKLGELQNSSSRQAEVVMARHGICDASMQQVILLCESISPALGGAMSQIRGMHSSYFAELQSLEQTFHEQLVEKDRYCEEAKREVEAIDSECSQLMEATTLLDAEAARNTTLILGLRKELREVNNEVARLHTMIDPDLLQSSRKLSDHHTSSNSSSYINKTFKSSTSSSTFRGSSSGVSDSPRGMVTSLCRDVKGQVTFDTLKSPSKPQMSTLSSTSQLTNSMKRIGINSQNSFTNDATRYMDATKSRKAAWGATTTNTSGALSGPRTQESSPKEQTTLLQTKTVYGSSSAWLMDFRGELQNKIDGGNIREISLKECRSLMQQFYDSKENQVSARVLASTAVDKKQMNTSVQLQDLETMEIHVYRSMEKKYGLRALAVEHAAMFLSGLKHFASEQIDVEVFYKIFCNEIEEGFIKVQRDLEKSIKDLLILQVMNKHVNKDQDSINEIVDEKLCGVVADHEYMDIVNYLYNEKDATKLRVILGVECQEAYDKKTNGKVDPRQHFEYKNDNITDESDMKKKLGYIPASRKDSSGHSNSSRRKDGNQQGSDRRGSTASSVQQKPKLPSDYFDIPYTTFVRLCLRFQLSNHERYLSTFRACFLYHDSDNDGILTTAEFRNCFMGLRCGEVHLPPEEMAGLSDEEQDMFCCLLKLVDPNGTDRITFSNAAERLNSIGHRASKSSKTKSSARAATVAVAKPKMGRKL